MHNIRINNRQLAVTEAKDEKAAKESKAL